SRVRRFPLAPLPPPVVHQLLARYRPELAQEQVEALTTLAGGSIGRALDLAGVGGVELYGEVLALLSREAGIDPVRLHAFADRVARGDADDAYRAVYDLVAQLLAQIAAAAAQPRAELGAAREDAVPRRLAGRAPA